MITNATNPTQSAADVCGMFVVDAGGKIVSANLSAHEFWNATGRSFVGTFLPSLFVLYADGDAGPADTDARWKTFKAATLDRWTSCPAQQAAGGAGRAVRLRLERAVGGAGSFIAIVRPEIAER